MNKIECASVFSSECAWAGKSNHEREAFLERLERLYMVKRGYRGCTWYGPSAFVKASCGAQSSLRTDVSTPLSRETSLRSLYCRRPSYLLLLLLLVVVVKGRNIWRGFRTFEKLYSQEGR